VSLTSQRFQKSARVAELATDIIQRIVTVVFSVWGQMFGRTHLRRVHGCVQKMTVFASAVRPLLLTETLKQIR
jgi:hypothetical protein